ncbi:hypothetical protein H4R35_002222, partial [Dimargaris xerosporica]
LAGPVGGDAMASDVLHFSAEDEALIRALAHSIAGQLDVIPVHLSVTNVQCRLTTAPPITFKRHPALASVLSVPGATTDACTMPTSMLTLRRDPFRWTTWKQYFQSSDHRPQPSPVFGARPEPPKTDQDLRWCAAPKPGPGLYAVTTVSKSTAPIDPSTDVVDWPVLTLTLDQLHVILSAFKIFRLIEWNPLPSRASGTNLSTNTTIEITESHAALLHDVEACLAASSGWDGQTPIDNAELWRRLVPMGPDAQVSAMDLEQVLTLLYHLFHYLPYLRLVNLPNAHDIVPVVSGTLSLALFKHLVGLELVSVPVTALHSWEQLSQQLQSLTVCGGLHRDLSTLFYASSLSQSDANMPKPWAHLHFLEMPSNSLTTLSSAAAQQLAQCVRLSLARNQLVELPASLCQLIALTTIDLSYNQLTSLSSASTTLGHITHLGLRANQLTDLMGLYKLWALEVLDIRDNKIATLDPFIQLVTLPSLQSLWLSGNPYCHTNRPDPYIPIFFSFQAKGMAIRLDGLMPTPQEQKRIAALFQEHDEPEVAARPHGGQSVNSRTCPTAPPALVNTSTCPDQRSVLASRPVRPASPSHGSDTASLMSHHSSNQPSMADATRRIGRRARDRLRFAAIDDSTIGHLASDSSPLESGPLPQTIAKRRPGTRMAYSGNPEAPSLPASLTRDSWPNRRSVLRSAELTRLYHPNSAGLGSLGTPSLTMRSHTVREGCLSARSSLSLQRPFSFYSEGGTYSLEPMAVGEPSLSAVPEARPSLEARRDSSVSQASRGSGNPAQFRDKVETMRQQAGSSWLKVFREMHQGSEEFNAMGSSLLPVAPLVNRQPTAPDTTLPTTSETLDDAADLNLPEFLFAASQRRVPALPPLPTRRTKAVRSTKAGQPPPLPSRSQSSSMVVPDASTLKVSASGKGEGRLFNPPSLTASAPVEQLEALADSTLLYPPDAVLLHAFVAKFTYSAARLAFQPDKAEAGASATVLCFALSAEASDSTARIQLRSDGKPSLLELDLGAPGDPQLLARWDLHSLLGVYVEEVTASDDDSLRLQNHPSIGLRSPSTLVITLDLKQSRYDDPLRRQYKIPRQFLSGSLDAAISQASSQDQRLELVNTADKLQALVKMLQGHCQTNWMRHWPREVCKQAKCLRCAWSGFIEPPASYHDATQYVQERVPALTTVTDQQPIEQRSSNPECRQCHSTFLVEFYGSDDQTSHPAVPSALDPSTDGNPSLASWPLPSSLGPTTRTLPPLASTTQLQSKSIKTPFDATTENSDSEKVSAGIPNTTRVPQTVAVVVARVARQLEAMDGCLGLANQAMVPLQTVTNAMRLFLNLHTFTEPGEKLLMWVPTAVVEQVVPYSATEPAAPTSTSSGTPSRWSILNWSAAKDKAAPPPSANGLASTPVAGAWPASVMPRCPAERPVYLALSSHRIYLLALTPAFYRQLAAAGAGDMTTKPNVETRLAVAQVLQQAEHHPDQYLAPVHTFSLSALGRIDVGPNRQYLTFHMTPFIDPSRPVPLSSASLAGRAGPASASVEKPPLLASSPSAAFISQGSGSGREAVVGSVGLDGALAGDAGGGSKVPTESSLTVLLRDRLVCSDFLNAFVIQCYESRIHVSDNKVRVVNHDVEWAIHNLRSTVFLQPGWEKSAPQSTNQTSSAEPASEPTQPEPPLAAALEPTTPAVTPLDAHGYGTAKQRDRLMAELQLAGATNWVDPASGSQVVVDKVTFEFLKMYYLVGWLTTAATPSNPDSLRLVPTTLVATPDFFYLCEERYDVWPPAVPRLLDLYQAQSQAPAEVVPADSDAGKLQHSTKSSGLTPKPSLGLVTAVTSASGLGTLSPWTKRSSKATLVAHSVPQYPTVHRVRPVASLVSVTLGQCCLLPGWQCRDQTPTTSSAPTATASKASESLTGPSPMPSHPALGSTATGWTHWVVLAFQNHPLAAANAASLQGDPSSLQHLEQSEWTLLFSTASSASEFVEALRTLSTVSTQLGIYES